MKAAPRKSEAPGLLAKLFPESKLRHVTIEEAENHTETVSTFLRTVRKARKGDCIFLPPGVYPFPEFSHSNAIKAIRPGTVSFVARAVGGPMTLGVDAEVWLSGIIFPQGSIPSINITKGSLFLSECHVAGGIEVSGKSSSIYLQGCWIAASTTGIDASDGATVEISASAVTGGRVGISATSGAKLTVLHSRIEAAVGPSPAEPGAGVHGDKAGVYLSGNLFAGNQIGVHLVYCPSPTILYCRVQESGLAGLMLSSGGPLDMHACSFAEQRSNTYAHITVEAAEATLSCCEMDDSTLEFLQADGGKVHRVAPASAGMSGGAPDQFAIALDEIRGLIGLDETKPILENILHQAHASAKRKEQGLPVLPQKFHMVFEGDEGSGRRRIAALLATALESLGALSKAVVYEARMSDFTMGGAQLAQVVRNAAGGILLLHAAEEVDRRESGISYNRARSVLQEALTACGSETILIFTGQREFVRPIVRSATEGGEIFFAMLRFPPPSPPELAQTFEALCQLHKIQLTSRAAEKVLLVMHMLNDRRDKRFSNSAGVHKLFEIAHKRFLERCSRERRFDTPLESGDIESPMEKNVEAVLAGSPAFVRICPVCGSENPWLHGLPERSPCRACGHVAQPSWGIWNQSSFYRRLLNNEDAPAPAGLPPLRRRAQGVA